MEPRALLAAKGIPAVADPTLAAKGIQVVADPTLVAKGIHVVAITVTLRAEEAIPTTAEAAGVTRPRITEPATVMPDPTHTNQIITGEVTHVFRPATTISGDSGSLMPAVM